MSGIPTGGIVGDRFVDHELLSKLRGTIADHLRERLSKEPNQKMAKGCLQRTVPAKR